jgi:hypothetical protein
MERAGCCDAMAERAARSRQAVERSEEEMRRRRRRRGEGSLLDGGAACGVALPRGH